MVLTAQEKAVGKFFDALNYKKQIEITNKAIEGIREAKRENS